MFTFIERWALNSSVKGSYSEIQIADMIPEGYYSAEFVVFTIQALRLIERTDSRRFNYVQRELRYIVNTPLLSAAAYGKNTHRCSVDYLRYRCARNRPEYEWYLAAYASAIVHEMTHGRLHSFGIPYNDHTWVRSERICRREEKRFTSRLRSEQFDFNRLVPEFDQADWTEDRSLSRFEHIKKRLARYHEIKASVKG